ncbi:unnamed protein product [Spirodela intermedia]|uniref:RIN4 pathogenic type III effector avirulence factor Avr cleavage site domain-containing protein n=1 Tax=Spirodela intermedia TaxID=51605 RepID=A0A7I8JEL3_SPIIN|nr:unnamed protein product [Spirodela intermedia]CAA6668391.1 unnamed protein product [Spirodela intermedia]
MLGVTRLETHSQPYPAMSWTLISMQGKGRVNPPLFIPRIISMWPMSKENSLCCSTVPKFGDWDENDPTSADNFTGIFKKVRDERKDGGKPPMISTDPEFEDNLRRSGKTSDTGCSCFGWFKK